MWQSASSETQRSAKQLEALRFKREKEEEEATRFGSCFFSCFLYKWHRLAVRVSNLASEKAALLEELERQKNKPVAQQQQQQQEKAPSNSVVMRAVSNATGFYYAAAQGTDPKKLEALQDKIRDLMLSRVVDFGVVALLAEEFGMEAGRRVFGVCLKVESFLWFCDNECFHFILFCCRFCSSKKDKCK